jgi:hypothetical protein
VFNAVTTSRKELMEFSLFTAEKRRHLEIDSPTFYPAFKGWDFNTQQQPNGNPSVHRKNAETQKTANKI